MDTLHHLYILKIKKIIKFILNPRFFLIFLKYRTIPGFEHKDIFQYGFKTIIDVGANRGQFSLLSHLFGSPTIYAFEPLKLPCKIFKKIFKNSTNVKIYNYAIGNHRGSVDINVSAKDDSSSIFDISNTQVSYFRGTEKKSNEKIKIALLTDFINPNMIISPSLMKIDVQGYELEVLKGSKKLLINIDYIYCECSFVELYKKQPLVTDVVTFLNSIQFELTGVFNLIKDKKGNSIQADFLFKNKNKNKNIK